MKMPAERTDQPTGKGKVLLSLFAVFALALAVRLVGITWGLPSAQRWYSYHPDESSRQIVGAVFSLLGGDFNPHFFNYPSLTVYATWISYWVLTFAGFGTTAVAPQYPWPLAHDIILAGRLFSALCGALTAPLVLLIARRIRGGTWGVLAAVLVALAPGHVQQSHFATVDVPATFFVTLCIYLSLRAVSSKGFLTAALVAGLAAGTKYNAGLVLLALLVALWWPFRNVELASKPKPVLLSLGLVFVALLGFALSTPYALLAPAEFWGDPAKQAGFAYELFVHPKEGSGDIFKGTGNGWIYHLTFNLPFVLTWPLIIAAALGIYFAAKKREFWPVLAFGGLFFLSLGLSQVRFMRYLLPLIPGLCLLAAFGLSRLPLKKVSAAVLALFALLGCLNVDSPFTQTDPRDQARAFTGVDRVALEEQPWFLTPPYQPNDRTTGPGTAPNVDVLDRNVDSLKNTEDKFVVQSEIFARERERLGTEDEFDKLLKERYPERQNFKNSVPLALPGRSFVPHDYLYTNPETRVYSRR
ncbi:phospholipid carrier-dependent glycosyltransferase [bacterium]|nr:MAG: phospholipid carrier-dependent glycosyltransferase [bacterium]